MADRLYLSFWLRGHSESNMLSAFGKMLRLFPFSKAPGLGSSLRIYAIEFGEPPLIELPFDHAPEAEEVLSAASQFLHGDSSYNLHSYWDLWQRDPDWLLAPLGVTLSCFGPGFDNETGDDLRVELGPDSCYLPDPSEPSASRKVQSNLRSLLRLSRELVEALPVERRLLWTESGDDFSERIRSMLGQPAI
jgi:hypothetical protein